MKGVKRIIGLLFLTVLAGVGGRAQVTERVTVFAAGDEGSRHYRIPALAVASDGSLIAVADQRGASQRDLPNIISVVCRRSTDGGRTWSPQRVIAQGDSATGATYGDAALVRDARTGALVCVFTGDRGFFDSTPEHPQRIYCSRSFDNGLTWEAPRDISAQFRLPGWQGFFAASGALTQTKEGRLLFVADTRLSPERRLRDIYEYVIASDDGGETWRVLNPQARVPSDGRGNESKVVVLTDGRLLMSIRTPGCRRFSYSADGGRTWSEADSAPALVEPDCNGDIIAVERGGAVCCCTRCRPTRRSGAMCRCMSAPTRGPHGRCACGSATRLRPTRRWPSCPTAPSAACLRRRTRPTRPPTASSSSASPSPTSRTIV